jgi:predicted phage tail protein
MDASVTKDGRVLVAYADGCLNSSGDEYGSSQPVSCSSVRESQDAWASVAYQATGEGLFSTYDTAAPQPTSTVPGTPTLTAEAGSRDVQLSWTQPSDGGAAITGYDIYRGTTSGGEQLLDAVPPRTTYVDHSVQAGTTYYYEVTAVNDNGQSPPSNETSAAPSRPARPQ